MKGEKKTPLIPEISLGNTPYSIKEMLLYISIVLITHKINTKSKGNFIVLRSNFFLFIWLSTII